jgi:hypothetical protein
MNYPFKSVIPSIIKLRFLKRNFRLTMAADEQDTEVQMLTNTTWKVVFCNQNLYSYKVHTCLEYPSVCPLVRIGTPTPSPASECVPPPEPKGGHTCLRAGEGVGAPIRKTEEKT